MDFELNQVAIFPPGTTVKVFGVASVPDRTAAPTGPSVDEAVVGEDGTVKFEGLSADVSYYAGAKIGEVWRYVHFTPGTPGVDVILDADGDETVTGDWSFAGETTFSDAVAVEALLTAEAALVEGALELDGDLNHDGTKIGFFGIAPAVRPEVKKAALTANELATALATMGIVKVEA